MGRTIWITGAASVLAATAALVSAPAHALDVYVQVAPQPYYQPHSYSYGQPRYVYGASSYGYNNGHHYGQRRRDLDRDGIPDRYDRDLDNDGRPNSRDRDRDGDGVPNRYDNDRRNRFGPNADLDRDGIANRHDRDIDGDGIRNARDAYPYDRRRS